MSGHVSTKKAIDNLLKLAALGGAVGLVVVAPNSAVALDKFMTKYIKNKKDRQETNRLKHHMKRVRLVEVIDNQNGTFAVELTDKGKKRSVNAQLAKLNINRGKWDRKWRIIMFDVPEKHKRERDFISFHMRKIGFKQLQKSVFVFPYPVEGFLDLLKDAVPEVSPYLVYLETEEIDAHNKLVRQFSAIL